MAEASTGAAMAKTDRPSIPTFLHLACCLHWLPLVAFGMQGHWIEQPGTCVAPFVLFGASCLAAATYERALVGRGKTLSVSCTSALGAIGALLPLPAAAAASTGALDGNILVLASSCLLGAGMGAQLPALETRLVAAGTPAASVLVCVALALYGTLFWLADLVEPPCVCLLAAMAALAGPAVSLWEAHRVRPLPCGTSPSGDDDVQADHSARSVTDDPCYPSRLLDNELAVLWRRLVVAVCLIGVPTGFMAVIFIAGVSTPPELNVAGFSLLAPVCFAALIGAGFLANREVDPFSTLAFTAILGIATFFPINPGSKFNQHLSLALCEIWVLVLVGCIAVLSCKVNALRMKAGKRVLPALPLLPANMAIGALAATMLMGTLWADGTLPYDQRAPFAAVGGMVTVASIYFGTNVVLTREHLRAAELAARGRITMSLPPEPHAPTAPRPGLTETCRAIAFDRGLTPREFDVLLILARGNELSKVQSELVISKGTAVTHRRNIYLKLDVHSRQELLDYVESYAGGDAGAQTA